MQTNQREKKMQRRQSSAGAYCNKFGSLTHLPRALLNCQYNWFELCSQSKRDAHTLKTLTRRANERWFWADKTLTRTRLCLLGPLYTAWSFHSGFMRRPFKCTHLWRCVMDVDDYACTQWKGWFFISRSLCNRWMDGKQERLLLKWSSPDFYYTYPKENTFSYINCP